MIGTVLNNTYRLESALTEGGMGQVFVASHLRIKGRKYAIKQLRPELASAPNFQTRFKVEAEVMMELEHPHIVRIEDFLVQDNAYYLVMEFIEGFTLDGHLSRYGAMETDEVHRLAVELLHGLEYCHQSGVIHRDLKPSNILLTKENMLKLTDFGIALQENTDKRLTRTGTILGTPDYMSPEQIMSYPLDGRSDIYSAGIILYEMSAGLPPFLRSHDTGGSYQILFAHVHRPPPDLDKAKIPSYLRKAIERSIKKDPAERFASAQEMLDFLEEARADEGLPPILHNSVHKPSTPSQAMSTFVPGEEPKPPAQGDGALDVTSALSLDAASAPSLDAASAASLDAAPAVGLNETTATPANSVTSTFEESAKANATPKPKGKRRWPLFLFSAFLAGVCGMLSWWMIEPESFAQIQGWVEQKTGIKAPIPSYTKRVKTPRRVIVLTPRRDRNAPLRVERRTPRPRGLTPRRALARRRALVPRRALIPRRAVANVGKRPTQPRLQPGVAPRTRVVVPWPVPLMPERRIAVVPPRRDLPRRAVPRIAPPKRPTTPNARRKPKVDVPLWGYRPGPPDRPQQRNPARRDPLRPVPPKRNPGDTKPAPRDPLRVVPPQRQLPDPVKRDPVKRDPVPVKRDPVVPHPERRAPPKRPPLANPRLAPRRVVPRQVEPRRVEPRRVEPRRVEPRRVEPRQIEPRQIEPRQIEPRRVEPRQVEPRQVEPRQIEPRRVVPRQVEPRRVVPRQVEPRQIEPRQIEPRRIAPRRLPPVVRPKSQPWPLPVSKQCAKLLQMCVRTCLQHREQVSPTFYRHCQRECWRTRIIQYKGQKICPPSPPAFRGAPPAPSFKIPSKRRKISL